MTKIQQKEKYEHVAKISIMRWFQIGCLSIILWSVAINPAFSSIVVPLSDKQMTLRAARIVRAKVVRKYSQWEKKERRIYTYITLAVLDSIKGNKSAQEVIIRQMGGVYRGIGMSIPGMPHFRLGEEVLLFLENSRHSPHHMVMGMSYGKYQVIRDLKKKTAYLTRNLRGLSLAYRTPKKGVKIVPATPLQAKHLVLDSFVRQIKTYLQLKTSPKPMLRIKRPTIKIPTLKTPKAPSLPRK